MSKRLFRLTVWCLRLYYPLIRLVGRIIGREDVAECLIEVSEENIKRTQEALGIKEGDE